MKPYYDEGGITIYHGDCRELLPTLSPFGLVLTDPPYNVGIHYGEGTDDERLDYAAWCADWFGTCRQLAPVVALTPGIANVGLWHQIEAPTWTLAWHKPAAMGRCVLGFNNWEPVLLWGKPQGVPMHSDVVTAPVVTDVTIAGHPCAKPIKWATALIGRLSPVSASVLDPFMGSGTTLRAAKDLGRRAVGIEIEERYCEIAVQRLAQEVLDVAA